MITFEMLEACFNDVHQQRIRNRRPIAVRAALSFARGSVQWELIAFLVGSVAVMAVFGCFLFWMMDRALSAIGAAL